MPAFLHARRLLIMDSATLKPPLLNFNLLSGGADGRVTFTRASTAWAFNSSGVLTSHATDVPRFDYNPLTLAPRGFLHEETRVNSLRNNSMTGGVAGTPGTLCTNWTAAATATGITRTIVGVGTVNGLPYIDVRYAGTATAGDTVLFFETTTGVAATNATTWASTAFLALQSGSLTNVTVKQGLRYRAAAGASIGTQIYETTIVPTSTLTRYERAATGADATIAFVVGSLTLTMASGAVDVTLRIATPQLELGSFATSPILTTAGTGTRAADVAPVLTSTFGYNAAEGTLLVVGTPMGVSSGLQTAIYLDDNTANERMGIRASAGTNAMLVVDGGSTQVNTGLGSLVAGTRFKAAFAYRANDFAGCMNGGTVQTDVLGTVPTITKMQIGSRTTGTEPLSGWYEQVSYYNRRLSNDVLARITT
jgi:hypothetical protein